MFTRSERRIGAALMSAPANLRRVHRWLADSHEAPDPSRRLVQATSPAVVCCLWGSLTIRRHSRNRRLEAGEMAVMAPGIWHRPAAPEAGGIGLSLAELAGGLHLAAFDRDLRQDGLIPAQPGRTLLAQLLREDDDRRRLRLASDLVHHSLAEDVRPLVYPHPAIPRMLDAAAANLHLGVTAADLVNASGLSTAQAYRLFRDFCRRPPAAFLEDRRLELAAGLLAGGCAIGDVSRQCGYRSRACFTRAWKRRHGHPPREHAREG